MLISNPSTLRGILRFTPKFCTRVEWTELPFATYDTKGIIRQDENFELECVFNYPGLPNPINIRTIIDDSETFNTNESYYFNNYQFFQLEKNVLILVANFNWYHPTTVNLYQFTVTGRLRGIAIHRLQTWNCKMLTTQKPTHHGQ
jgi:hypothetical protein